MRRPSIPFKAKLQPHSQERPQPNHQTETKHNHPKTWKPTMARHAHPMAGRPNHIPQTIPSTQQSRIRLQRLKTMLRKPPSQPQENSPETRTPPENSQLQHRNSQPNNNQTRKQITFHSLVAPSQVSSLKFPVSCLRLSSRLLLGPGSGQAEKARRSESLTQFH